MFHYGYTVATVFGTLRLGDCGQRPLPLEWPILFQGPSRLYFSAKGLFFAKIMSAFAFLIKCTHLAIARQNFGYSISMVLYPNSSCRVSFPRRGCAPIDQ